MAVLADADILQALEAGELVIEPFRRERLTPNGYDLAVAEVVLPDGDWRVREGAVSVPPLARFAVATEERLALGPNLTAQLWIRTTWARRGVLGSFGKVDAGFRGTLTLVAFNAAAEPVTIPVGEAFAQVAFERLTAPARATYPTRSGRYQDQEGVRLS